MSFFHKRLDAILNKVEHIGLKQEVVQEHVRELEEVFKLDKQVHTELYQYYEHLKAAEKDILKVRQDGTDAHPNWSGELDNHIKAAQALISDIERKLRKEFTRGHKFLE